MVSSPVGIRKREVITLGLLISKEIKKKKCPHNSKN